MTTSGESTTTAALVGRAIGLVSEPGRAIVGVAGPPGSGKSTLAEALVSEAERLRGPGWAAYVPMDGFHLGDLVLGSHGLLDRKGAPETFDVGGFAALLARLRADDEEIVYAPGFERGLEQPIAANVEVPRSARLVVTEGNYLLLDAAGWPRVRALLDEVWYCASDDAVRVKRLIARHVAFGKSPDAARAWVLRSDEANARLVESTRSAADLIVETP